MNRQEQIQKAALEYVNKSIQDKGTAYLEFIEAVEWADHNPDADKVYTKEELRDMGFGFDLNGNIETPEECYKRAEQYIEHRKKKFIEKAYNWLNKELSEDKTEPNPYYKTDVKSLNYDKKEDFMFNFRKAMEE